MLSFTFKLISLNIKIKPNKYPFELIKQKLLNMHKITCKGIKYFHTIVGQRKIIHKLVHSYFEIPPQIITTHPELTHFL